MENKILGVKTALSQGGFLFDLDNKGLDIQQIVKAATAVESTRADKFQLAAQVLSSLATVDKKGGIIKDSSLFPQTTGGASFLIALITSLLPVDQREEYLIKVANIDKLDGIEGNDLTKAEIAQVFAISISELIELVPVKSSTTFGKIFSVVKSILPMILGLIGKK